MTLWIGCQHKNLICRQPEMVGITVCFTYVVPQSLDKHIIPVHKQLFAITQQRYIMRVLAGLLVHLFWMS